MNALGSMGLVLLISIALPVSLSLVTISMLSLLRIFLFISIWSGLLRRIATWTGFVSDANVILYLLPFICFLIGLKLLVNVIKSTNLIAIGISWSAIFLALIIASFFPTNQGILASMFTLGAFVPLIILFIVGNLCIDSGDIVKLKRDLKLYCVFNSSYTVYQYMAGFPPWDQRWIDSEFAKGFWTLVFKDNSRTFGILTSPAECASLLALSFFIFLNNEQKRIRKIDATFAFISIFALLTTGVRTSIILFVVTFFLTFKYLFSLRTIPMLAVGAFVTSLIISEIIAKRGEFERIIQAFTNPFSVQSVSARQQSTEIALDLLQENPFGFGLSSLVNSATKIGSVKSRTTDFIFGDAVASMGVIGVLIAAFLIMSSLSQAIFRIESLPVWIMVLPLLQINYILNPNHYGVTPLAWLTLGVASKFTRESRFRNQFVKFQHKQASE